MFSSADIHSFNTGQYVAVAKLLEEDQDSCLAYHDILTKGVASNFFESTEEKMKEEPSLKGRIRNPQEVKNTSAEVLRERFFTMIATNLQNHNSSFQTFSTVASEPPTGTPEEQYQQALWSLDTVYREKKDSHGWIFFLLNQGQEEVKTEFRYEFGQLLQEAITNEEKPTFPFIFTQPDYEDGTNTISDFAMQVFKENLHLSPKKVHLRFERVILSDCVVTSLCEMLKAEKVRSLTISNCKLSDDAQEKIRETAEAHNCTITF